MPTAQLRIHTMPTPQEKVIEVRQQIIGLNDQHRLAKQLLLIAHPDLHTVLNSITNNLHQILERIKDKLSELSDLLEQEPD